jgi:hypothetical protein
MEFLSKLQRGACARRPRAFGGEFRRALYMGGDPARGRLLDSI